MEDSGATVQHLEGKCNVLTMEGITSKQILKNFDEQFQEVLMDHELFKAMIKHLKESNLHLTMGIKNQVETVELLERNIGEKKETIENYGIKVQKLEEERQKKTQELSKYKERVFKLELDNDVMSVRSTTHTAEVKTFKEKLVEMLEQQEESERRMEEMERKNKELRDLYQEMMTEKQTSCFRFFKRGKKKEKEREVEKQDNKEEDEEGQKEKKTGRFRRWIQRLRKTK